MKIHIFCMNSEGRIACGMMTSNEQTANDYIRRKTERGFIAVKQYK